MYCDLVAAHAAVKAVRDPNYEAPPEPFDMGRHWDLDSTPMLIKLLSRGLGIRTPKVEASLVLASLAHDVRYYYGGSRERKSDTDARFAHDLRRYARMIDASRVGFVASADLAAVKMFGGAPFIAGYAWSFGKKRWSERGYREAGSETLAAIDEVARVAVDAFVHGRYALLPWQQYRLPSDVLAELQALRGQFRVWEQLGMHGYPRPCNN